MEIDLELRWRVIIDGQPVVIDELLFSLLDGVESGGHLKFAAKAAGVSYRHAWGLVRTWEERFGVQLLDSRRGRGAALTLFAAGLLASREETGHGLQATLAKHALRVSASIDAAIKKDHRTVRIATSHDEKILQLRKDLERLQRQVAMEIVGSEGALRHYRRGDADVAGFHLPMGELGRTVAARLIEFLDDKYDEIFMLEKRFLGLMSRQDNPCRNLEAIISNGHRFVNRQAGSATRLTFDGLLGALGLAPGDVHGYADEEYTHTAVAALVVSRDADVAFGEKRVADHFGLAFEQMVEERFYLVIKREFDSVVRQFVADYCALRSRSDATQMKADEFTPTVAVMKRVHNAGFWKKV